VEALNRKALAPDLTLFLRVRPAVAFRRRKAATVDREIFEESAFQRRVGKSYDRAILRLRATGQRIVEIDGEQAVAGVAAAVLSEVERLR
jgi:dTMP kinase